MRRTIDTLRSMWPYGWAYDRVFRAWVCDDGSVVIYETGTYYGIIGGPNADEVVGVVVLTGSDPRAEGVDFQETGGFILYRDPPE